MGGFDDYALADAPAVGSTGVVSWARHVSTGEAVAVTELGSAAASDEAFLVRLRTSAATLAKVAHPNVLPIREVVEGSGRVWVVEDWVEGRELGEVLADGRLTAEQSVTLADGILRGLTAVHRQGVVHGDISPLSIVIGRGGGPRLVGFGFAGLPGRAPADARGDVLAVAVVLRDLLAGGARHPKLEAVVAGATSDRPKDRPKDAAAFRSALEKAARSDFGRGWTAKPSLAIRAVARPVTEELVGPSPAEDDPEGIGGDVPPVSSPEPAPAELSPPAAGPEIVEADGEAAAAPEAAASPEPAPAEPSPPATAPEIVEADPEVARSAPPDDDGAEATDVADSQPDEETGPVLVPTASAAESEETVDASAPSGLVAPAEAPEAVGPVPLATADSAEPKGPTPAAAATRPAPPAKTGSGPKKPPPKRPKKKTPRTAPAPTAPQVPVPAATAPPPPPPVTGPSERKGRGRRPQPRGVVRGLAGVIMILLGAGTAVALERNQASDTQAETAGRGGPTDDGAPKPEAATASQIAGADIIGEWLMTLAVFESTGFFGTQVGQSVEKTYTIRSDCSAAPCVLRLAVSGTTGEYELRKQPQEYLLLATGPQDCIDLPTGAVRVPNGGVASVTVHLRPTTASRTPRGDWMATGLSGSVVTTFDTSNPACVQGSGVQRSTAVGVRQ